MRKLIVIVYAFAYICSSIYSQTAAETGKFKGLVTDKNGKALEYVSVTVQDLALNTSTDEKGNFAFRNVTPGDHLLTFKRSGYESISLTVSISDKDTTYNIILNESLIETGVIDVTSSFNATDISKSTFSITELSSRNLTKSRSQTLAETIQNIPGISNVSTGSGIGKPVIRGLTSQSVLIVHDGVKHESQSWGDEHGPELSLFDLERIEILRGPASLIYGAEGIGGVVNVITKPLEFSSKSKPVLYGDAVAGGFSVDKQLFGNLTLGIGLKNLGLKGHFGYRKTDNLKTPDGIFVVNTIDGERSIIGGELFNSGSNEVEGGATLGFNGKFGTLNLGFETFARELQIHEDPLEDPEATPNQKINTDQFSLDGNFNLSGKLKLEPVLSYQSQARKEFESIEDKQSGIEALHLELKTLDGSLKLHHELSKNITGTFGGTFNYQKNETLADEKLIPNYNAGIMGVFLLEKYSMKFFTFSAGARFDSKKLNIEETVFEVDSSGNPVKTLNPQSLTFNAFTGSFGAVYSPNSFINIYSNIGRGWRSPSEFELFVDGVHEGTVRYDKGLKILDSLAEPKPEESLNLDLGVRLNYKNLSIQLSVYRNVVDNFIYPAPTSDTIEGFQVYNIKQDKSTFYGYEYSIQFQPAKWMVISANGDYVNTENNATGNPLPFTPPMKNLLEIKFQKSSLGKFLNPYIKFTAKFVSGQDKTDPLESKTDGYTLLNAGIGFDLAFAKSVASVDLSFDNLADTKYVDHLSRYKNYAMNPGRSINLQVSVPFKL